MKKKYEKPMILMDEISVSVLMAGWSGSGTKYVACSKANANNACNVYACRNCKYTSAKCTTAGEVKGPVAAAAKP
jgi:hypothetical protein